MGHDIERQRPELGKVSEEGSHTNVFKRIISESSRVGLEHV